MARELYIWSGHISIGSTLPLTPADAAAHKATSVQGSVLCQRDLDELVDQLDITGESEYRRAMRGFGAHAEPFQVCECPIHEGRRDLPERAFRSGDNYCLRCRMRIEGGMIKRPGVKAKHGKFMKAFRPRRYETA